MPNNDDNQPGVNNEDILANPVAVDVPDDRDGQGDNNENLQDNANAQADNVENIQEVSRAAANASIRQIPDELDMELPDLAELDMELPDLAQNVPHDVQQQPIPQVCIYFIF